MVLVYNYYYAVCPVAISCLFLSLFLHLVIGILLPREAVPFPAYLFVQVFIYVSMNCGYFSLRIVSLYY